MHQRTDHAFTEHPTPTTHHDALLVKIKDASHVHAHGLSFLLPVYVKNRNRAWLTPFAPPTTGGNLDFGLGNLWFFAGKCLWIKLYW
jgi:hypothetical protein